jgi:hypothetical protein
MKRKRFWMVALVLALLLGSLATSLPVGGRAVDGAQSAPGPAGAALLSPDQAAAVAMNDLEATADGYCLRHPRHTATFTPEGLQFMPRRGGLEWAWRLTFVGAGDAPLAGVATGPVPPTHLAQGVAYPRGGLVEQYQAQKNTIEQQFIIHQPLPLGGADLVIAGAVESTGAFEATATGWLWRAEQVGVRLGNVRVYDAQGATLPATMAVTADATRIVVDGNTLVQAVYPVTIDPEIGSDFRLSSMGPDVSINYDALDPAVAYNSHDNQYLVVWSGSDDTVGEYEIWGQRVDAATGAQIGADDFQISLMGPADDPAYDAEDPAVAYNSQNNEYLVVWSADYYTDGDYEIFGQRLTATGTEVSTDFRISVMGPDGNANYDALNPVVAYNSTDNQYLVVWYGDDDSGSLVNEEYEIWGKRLEGNTDWIGTDFRISDMGGTGDAAYDARDPDVAYNSTDNQYLIVWEGDDTATGLVNDEFEIWGQRLNATGGGEGSNDFRISDMGGSGNADYDAGDPAVAYNSLNNQYLVVWEGDNAFAEMYDIFGQRLTATGGGVGSNDFYVSNPGNGPNDAYDALNPAVAYDRADNEYLVVWQDDELGVGEFEIWGQRVDAATGDQIDLDTRLSDMGPDGNASYIAQTPAVAYSGVSNNYLVVWSGDNSTDGEFEIWGQRFTGGQKVYLPIILKNH